MIHLQSIDGTPVVNDFAAVESYFAVHGTTDQSSWSEEDWALFGRWQEVEAVLCNTGAEDVQEAAE